jgi:hypothetical protein
MNNTKGLFTRFGALVPALFALSGCTVDTFETGEDVDVAQEPLNEVFWVNGVGDTSTLLTMGADAMCQAKDLVFGGFHVGRLSGGTCKYPIFSGVGSSSFLMQTLHKNGTPTFTDGNLPPFAIKSASGRPVCFSFVAPRIPGEQYPSGNCHYVGYDGTNKYTNHYYFVSPGPVIIP